MAKFDVGTMVDYVLRKTRRDQLHFVGHSQGALTMLVKLTQNDGFGAKVGGDQTD